jgi:hypothetical protein
LDWCPSAGSALRAERKLLAGRSQPRRLGVRRAPWASTRGRP